MRFSSSYHVIPPQHRCVWMMAGVLSYQLCDREFDCDHCPLDAAMRKRFDRTAHTEPTKFPSVDLEAAAVNCYYSRNHCWLMRVSSDTVRVGIEPHFALLLGSVNAVALPSADQDLVEHQIAVQLVHEGGTLPVRSPLHGTVTAVNERLAMNPNRVLAASMSDGWLFEMSVPDFHPKKSGLVNTRDSVALFAGHESLLRGAVNRALNVHAGTVGVTLPDGGAPMGDVAAAVGMSRFIGLVKEIYLQESSPKDSQM